MKHGGVRSLSTSRKMLVFHSAYIFDDLTRLGLEIFVTSRDAGEHFDRVLTVNPVASLQFPPGDSKNFTKPQFYQLDSRNVVLEGRANRFKLLNRLKALDLVIAQFSLFVTLIRKGGLRDVDLVRAEDPRFNGLYGYVLSRLLRKPLVVGVWGNPARIRKSQGVPLMPRLFPSIRSEEILEKFVLRRASIVLAQNQDNIEYAIDYGADPSKAKILPLGIGIDPAHFLPYADRMDVSEDFKQFGISSEFVIVCISRLEALKLVDQAVRACSVLKRANLDFKLILIGEGRERANLEALARELGISNEVIFAGNRTQEWISGALARSHLVLAPLTGRALLETALSGCPVVAYDVDWHGEIVRTGETGILVENLSYEDMGEAALRLFKDESSRQKMSQNIQKLAMEMASPQVIIEMQMDIYKRLTQE